MMMASRYGDAVGIPSSSERFKSIRTTLKKGEAVLRVFDQYDIPGPSLDCDNHTFVTVRPLLLLVTLPKSAIMVAST